MNVRNDEGRFERWKDKRHGWYEESGNVRWKRGRTDEMNKGGRRHRRVDNNDGRLKGRMEGRGHDKE